MSIIPIQLLSWSDLSLLGANVLPSKLRKRCRKGRQHERSRQTHHDRVRVRQQSQQVGAGAEVLA
jgi:hypothetical protein